MTKSWYNDILFTIRNHEEPAGTTAEDVYEAKRIVESSFHPDTGDKQVKPLEAK